MTLKEVILKVLQNQETPLTVREILNLINKNDLYDWKGAKTPDSTVSSYMGDFIRSGDSRVRRISKGRGYGYYLSSLESELGLDTYLEDDTKVKVKTNKKYGERDLHPLLSSYVSTQNIHAKTIFHERSNNSRDSNQTWTHPDIVGVQFTRLKSIEANSLLKTMNRTDTAKIHSYELKKEINTDTELKKAYFQAVSNSSWANYGYLVAFEFSDALYDEMQRLNQSFGIGIIELGSNPFESRSLFPPRFRELDFKTIDKIARINPDFGSFIRLLDKTLRAPEEHYISSKNELEEACDTILEESEIDAYIQKHHIPTKDIDISE